ncbi:MAG TPA: acyl-CoA dehydrogenase family protein [Gemmatimonadaceae bacterium]|nr:acyl-CoA dehydrogenase family protein [Gemmatimonadaceae bacterium]
MTAATVPHLAARTGPDAVALAGQVARAVAAPAASHVDRNSRFPSEAIAALREARLMSALVPVRYGGLGCSIVQVAEICDVLGQHCTNTAMVYAMHQIQVAVLARHAGSSPFFERLMRDLVERQLLLASATSEVEVGGDVRRSICAVERRGDDVQLRKQAPVISYGEHADAILVTARRHPDAAASDQVLVVAPTDASRTTLTRTSGWDALGLRGTCSSGYVLETRVPASHILADAYDDISAHTMLPVSHVLWSSLWLGLATDAVSRARAFVRDAAKRKPGTMPPGAVRLAEAVGVLQTMRAAVTHAANAFDAIYEDRDALSSMGFALRMNGLKVQSATLAVQIVSQALSICGIAGYKTDTKYSVERHLRDAYSAGIQINNDRVLGASATMLLVHREDA